jgi:VWFA-related protein
VDVTTIDVAVVNGRGEPVEDLGAAEFAVKIDGEVRRVVTAQLVKIDPAAEKKPLADDAFFTTNITPPNGRQIVLAIDQMNIGPAAIKPILSAASNFLDNLSPLDHVALATYPEPGPRVGFTTDKLKVRLALEQLIGHPGQSRARGLNIGVAEAFDISERRDRMALAAVLARECRTSDTLGRAQCERDVASEASDITRRVKEDAERSLLGLRQLLERLTTVDGPKSLILISQGLAVDNPTELASIVELAGRARASINVLLVDLERNDVSIAERAPTESEDRRIQTYGLEALATMSRGSLFHVVGTGEPIFHRLSSEISAYYLLGVERRPGDADGGRHRIDVELRRRDVTIRSRQAFVVSSPTGKPQSVDDSLRDALLSPFAVSGVPLRVSTFVQQDPESDKVRLTIAAQVDQPGAVPAEYTVGFLLVDDQNRVAVNMATKRMLARVSASPTEPLEFIGGVMVDAGVYSLRFGVVDAQGRRGSIVREVAAWKMTGEEFATGDLIVGAMPAPDGIQASVEPHVTTDRLGAIVELYSTAASTFDGTTVTFEIGDDQDSPSLTTAPARLLAMPQATWRTATAVIPAQALPPGRYVARAKIARDGKAVGVLARPFVLERPGMPAASTPAAPAAMPSAAVSFGPLAKFDPQQALRPEMVGAMLDIVEKRSAALRDTIVAARAGRYGPAALEALGAGEQDVAAFFRGLDLFTRGQLDEAATQLHIAAGERRDFFPAAFYLGAAFASVGRDREAAGVWQSALGTEPRPAAVYAIVADARLRDGQPASAIDVLKPAYERNRTDDGITRRLGIAYVMTGQHAQAVPILDDYLTRNPTDQDALLAAIIGWYEFTPAGQPLSTADLAKLRKYSAAYRGAQEALVSKYIEVLESR